jgi:prephenate dehydrogenase
MKELKQITVLGLGLLGGSISLSAMRALSGVRTVGYSHRASTREKARDYSVASEVADDSKESVRNADIVILATPILTFEQTFIEIADALPKGCIVTDVGSTKTLPHRWAAKRLPKDVFYVGSHPIAGSEKRGLEFSRDDLFDGAVCVLTTDKGSNKNAVNTLQQFWTKLGCKVLTMQPGEHDRIYARISHLPHIVAAALINANDEKLLKFAGKGFIDTSRIASGPENIWSDILMTNKSNIIKGIDRVIVELEKMKDALGQDDERKVNKLLTQARKRRETMINYKIDKKELI